MAREDYIEQFRMVGKALMRRGMQNSHSGNICVKEFDNGQWKIYITSSGSPLGNLIDTDIVPVGFDSTTWGVFRASSENRIHKAILRNDDTFASIHAHIPNGTLLSFDEDGNFLVPTDIKDNYLLVPIDKAGAYHLNSVPVREFEHPVGSVEMIEKIPPCLKDHKVMIVKGHGAFGRGKNLRDVLYNISLLEYSATVLMYAKLLNVDTRTIQNQVIDNLEQLYPVAPDEYQPKSQLRIDTKDQIQLEQFKWAGQFIYDQGLSPFHTGSMSVRTGKSMLYCPNASTPQGLPSSILKVPIDITEKDSPETITHKEIYQRTRLNAIIHTFSPESTAESFAGIAAGRDVLYPIDAEASYINPRVALCDTNPDTAELIKKLHEHKSTVIVKGQGIWSAGKNTLEQAIHNPSSARMFSYFRIQTHILQQSGLLRPLEFQEKKLQQKNI